MYMQLHDYDDFRGFDLPNGAGLDAIPNQIYAVFSKQSRLTH